MSSTCASAAAGLYGDLSILKKLRGIATKKDYTDSTKYNKEKNTFGFVADLIGLLTNIALLPLGPIVWDALDREWSIYAKVAAYSTTFSIIGFFLSMPLTVYSTFVIEEKHGFNNHTARSFLGDKVKGLLLNSTVGLALESAMVWILDHSGKYAWFYLWMCVTGFVFFFSI